MGTKLDKIGDFYMYKESNKFYTSTLSFNDAKSFCEDKGLRLPKVDEVSGIFEGLPYVMEEDFEDYKTQKVCYKEYDQNFIWSENSNYGINICSGEQKEILNDISRSVICIH